MDHPSIRWEEIPDYAKQSTWDLLHLYIDTHSQISIDECQGDGVQAILIFQSQCANMTFDDQIRYNRLFQKVAHKRGESSTNYTKIFQNDKTLSISVKYI